MEKKYIISFLFLCISFLAGAQNIVLNYGEQHSPCKIYTKNRQTLLVRKLELITDSTIQFVNSYNSNLQNYHLDDIVLIKKRTGNKALKYGAIGASIGLLSSLYTHLHVSADPSRNIPDNALAIYAGITMGTAAIGAIIGAASPTWKTIKKPNSYSNKLVRFSINPILITSHNKKIGTGISIQLNL